MRPLRLALGWGSGPRAIRPATSKYRRDGGDPVGSRVAESIEIRAAVYGLRRILTRPPGDMLCQTAETDGETAAETAA
jgi:hypothetical protein